MFSEYSNFFLYSHLAVKPPGRQKVISVNEDNIETLVGLANIANPNTEGNEEEKVTIKDEKAEGAASKNLGKQFLTLLNAFVSNNEIIIWKNIV